MPFKNVPKLYNVWASMKDRCLNTNSASYHNYGGRGISICEKWVKSYTAFESDMGDRPKGYSLDRIDNNGDYCPENCRWADKKTQQRNQRRAVYVEIEGKKYRAIELSETYGVKTDFIVSRAKKGLPFDQVVSRDKLHNFSGLSFGGKASGDKRKLSTHCSKGHEYTEETTYITKQGWRNCRICHKEKMRILNHKKYVPFPKEL